MIKTRFAIDRVNVKFLSPSFYKPQPDLDSIIKYKDFKMELRACGYSASKFPAAQGLVTCNFFGGQYRICNYEPLFVNFDKVIFWMVWDPETLQSAFYFNVNEMLLLVNEIEHCVIMQDTNFIPVNIDLNPFAVMEMFYNCIRRCTEMHYIRCGAEPRFKILSAIEVCEEMLGAAWMDFNFTRLRQKVQTKFSSSNNTLYVNPFLKKLTRQLKIYEKTPGLIRFEYTFHKLPLPDKKSFPIIIQNLVDESKEIFGSDLENVGRLHSVNFDGLLDAYAVAWKIDREIVRYLVNHTTYKFTRENQSEKEKLLTRKLIKRDFKRGFYHPTEQLIAIIDSLFGLFEPDLNDSLDRLPGPP